MKNWPCALTKSCGDCFPEVVEPDLAADGTASCEDASGLEGAAVLPLREKMQIWLFKAHRSGVGVFSVALNLFFYGETCATLRCLRVNQS